MPRLMSDKISFSILKRLFNIFLKNIKMATSNKEYEIPDYNYDEFDLEEENKINTGNIK